jgi:hypothetical protein
MAQADAVLAVAVGSSLGFEGRVRFMARNISISANPIPKREKEKSWKGMEDGIEGGKRFWYWKRKRSFMPSSISAPAVKAMRPNEKPVKKRLSRRKAAPAASVP